MCWMFLHSWGSSQGYRGRTRMRRMTTDTAAQIEQFPLQQGNMPFAAITSPLRHDTSASGPQTIHYRSRWNLQTCFCVLILGENLQNGFKPDKIFYMELRALNKCAKIINKHAKGRRMRKTLWMTGVSVLAVQSKLLFIFMLCRVIGSHI